MNNEKEEKIIKYLINKYNPEVIFLWGSRVKNTNHDNSDWDLYLIGDFKIENEQHSESMFWEHLDIALFPKNILLKDKVLKIFYGPLSHLQLLHDNSENFWAEILIYTEKAYLDWPINITEIEIENELIYLKRILSKIIAYKNNPEVTFFHIAQFYRKIIPFWFKINWKWSLPVQQAIPIIKKEDYKFYLELEKIANWKNIEIKIEWCSKIIDNF